MKPTSQMRLLGAAITALLCASCASNLDTTRVPMAASSPSGGHVKGKKGDANSLHASINNYRRSIGKAPLQRHGGLDRLAQEHCEFMAKNQGKFSLGSKTISHYGFEQRAKKAQFSYGMENVAENIAGGKIASDVSGTLTHSWVNSKKHIYNIKQDWDFTGVGVYKAADGTVYATQLFATKGIDSHMSMMNRMTGF